MWQILKAEFEYYKTVLLLAYGLALLFLVFALLWLNTGAGALISFTTITYAFACIIVGATHENEKRMRFHSILPVRPVELGMVDVLFVALFHFGMCVLWIAFPLLQTGRLEAPTLPNVFFGFATMQSAIAVFMINVHLRFVGRKNYQWITFAVFITSGAVLGLLHYAGYFSPAMRLLAPWFKSLWGTALMIVIWLGLAALSIVLFARRKSYLV